MKSFLSVAFGLVLLTDWVNPAQASGDAAQACGAALCAGEAPAADEGIDCNGNGVEDAVDIASGYSVDLDGNGVPDECDAPRR